MDVSTSPVRFHVTPLSVETCNADGVPAYTTPGVPGTVASERISEYIKPSTLDDPVETADHVSPLSADRNTPAPDVPA
jgi:hypothetical protein